MIKGLVETAVNISFDLFTDIKEDFIFKLIKDSNYDILTSKVNVIVNSFTLSALLLNLEGDFKDISESGGLVIGIDLRSFNKEIQTPLTSFPSWTSLDEIDLNLLIERQKTGEVYKPIYFMSDPTGIFGHFKLENIAVLRDG